MRSLFQKIFNEITKLTFITALANRLMVILSLGFCSLDIVHTEKTTVIKSVTGTVTAAPGEVWLSHEHILVDFIGADSIDPKKWDHDSVINAQ